MQPIAISWHSTTIEKYASDTNQIRLRWDASTKTLSVHDANSGHRHFAAEASQIPMVLYQKRSQALFFKQWNDKSKTVLLATASINVNDAGFYALVTILKNSVGPENVCRDKRT